MPALAVGMLEEQARFHRLFRRLQGGGYSTSESGVRDNLLFMWALAAAIGKIQIQRAANQSILSVIEEDGGLLLEVEREYRLRADAARTVLERQRRLMAVERAAGASLARAEAALQTEATSAQIEQPTRAHVEADAVEDAAIFQHRTRLSEDDFDTVRLRESVEHILHRILPARAHGQLSAPDEETCVTGPNDAEWANPDHELDRDALRMQTAVDYRAHPGTPTRMRSYGPASKLRSADINAWQDATLWGPANANASYFSANFPGGDHVAFAIPIASGADVIVDSSIDWRDRYTMVRVRRSSTDIRPGQAFDDSWGGVASVSGLAYWGSGGAAYRMQLEGAAPGLGFQVSTVDGALHITNSTGGTRYVAGLLLATRFLGRR